MNERYSIGQFGRWQFTIKKKAGVFSYDIEGAMATEQDKKFIWLLGTDGMVYCVEKSRIMSFDPMPTPKGVFEISVV